MGKFYGIAEIAFSALCSALITAWYVGLYSPENELVRHIIFVGGALVPLGYLYRLHRIKTDRQATLKKKPYRPL